MPSLLLSLLLRLAYRNPTPWRLRGKAWRKEDVPLVEEDQVRDHLSKLDTHKSMGPNGICLRVLREPADVFAKAFSIIFEGHREPEKCLRTGGKPTTL